MSFLQIVLKSRCLTGGDILKELQDKEEEERKEKERIRLNKIEREKKKEQKEIEKEERYFISFIIANLIEHQHELKNIHFVLCCMCTVCVNCIVTIFQFYYSKKKAEAKKVIAAIKRDAKEKAKKEKACKRAAEKVIREAKLEEKRKAKEARAAKKTVGRTAISHDVPCDDLDATSEAVDNIDVAGFAPSVSKTKEDKEKEKEERYSICFYSLVYVVKYPLNKAI